MTGAQVLQTKVLSGHLCWSCLTAPGGLVASLAHGEGVSLWHLMLWIPGVLL